MSRRSCIGCGKRSFKDRSRYCAPCKTSADKFEVPSEFEFSEEQAFMDAPELARIGNELIAHYQEFYHIQQMDVSIDFLWKAKGGTNAGNNVLGRAQKTTGELKYYSNRDFVIWVAADHCYWFNAFQITALIFHELMHIHFNEEEIRMEIRGHYFEGFPEEVEVFGCWKESMLVMAEAFKGEE